MNCISPLSLSPGFLTIRRLYCSAYSPSPIDISFALYSSRRLPLALEVTTTLCKNHSRKMSGPASKKQRTMPQFELLYWPTMPGRGEFIRLPLEATGVAYNDVCNEQKSGMGQLSKLIDSSSTSDSDGNPVAFAPPVLRVTGAGKDGTSLVIHQTPAILAYLAPQIGMVPEDDAGAAAYVAQIALTALDLNNETHDTHHPVGVSLVRSSSYTQCRGASDRKLTRRLVLRRSKRRGPQEGKGLS